MKQSVEHLGDDVEVHEFSGLVTDLAKRADIGASFMVRGIRSASEFEYEHRLSYLNREVADMETVFLVADEKLLFTSSSAVREVSCWNDASTSWRCWLRAVRGRRLLAPLTPHSNCRMTPFTQTAHFKRIIKGMLPPAIEREVSNPSSWFRRCSGPLCCGKLTP